MTADVIDIAEARERTRSLSRKVVRERLRPPPQLTVSEWADQNRVLPETSARPGRWRTSTAPYLRGIMDACSDPKTERVVIKKSAQVGGTECLNNVVGYYIDQDPAPILVVQYSVGEAEKYSKERLAPMLKDTPCLQGKVSPPRSRDSDNTILAKRYPGGHLGIVGANAPAGLRARARRVILFDEVDAYPASAGGEGDPIALAERRATTFWNRLLVYVSTPKDRETSRVEKLWQISDQRRYHVDCPDCGHSQHLEFENLKWDKEKDADGRTVHLPETVAYACNGCGSHIEQRHKMRMLRGGRWIADRPGRRIAGFHLNALYSPWTNWVELVERFLEAKSDPELLKVFVNTLLGEVWDEAGNRVDEEPLVKRREKYSSNPLPEKVVCLTAGVDIQEDRMELEIVGWGEGEESWSIDYLIIPGDPSVKEIWTQLDAALLNAYDHPKGFRLRVAASAIDSGHFTQQVYRFAKARRARRVWAIKGREGAGTPIWGRASAKNRQKVALYPVGVDNAKTTLFARLQIDEPGAGYCHFPLRYEKEYFRQLTGEHVVKVHSTRTRQVVRRWKRLPNRRNEALDCRVYAMAALEGLVTGGLNLSKLAHQLLGASDAPVRGSRRGRVRSKGVAA